MDARWNPTTADADAALDSGIEALRAKRGWIIALGIIYVIAGLIALGSVVMATVVSVFVVGIMMLIAGVAEVIHAFQVKSWGKFLFWLLLGGLSWTPEMRQVAKVEPCP